MLDAYAGFLDRLKNGSPEGLPFLHISEAAERITSKNAGPSDVQFSNVTGTENAALLFAAIFIIINPRPCLKKREICSKTTK